MKPIASLHRSLLALAALALPGSLFPAPVAAEVWLSPGDAHARSASQYLADQPGSTGLAMEWPQWAQSGDGGRADDSFAAGLRQWVAKQEQQAALRVELRAATDTPLIRTFADESRSQGEIGARARFGGDRCGALLQIRVVADPDDDQSLRPDGTVAGCKLGNWRLSAGWEERWWGPGWNGSLILGTNARPTPGFSITRDVVTPSSLPVLEWFGEWRATAFVSRMESSRRDVRRPLLLGARISFRPNRVVEIGISRTAQMCGKGRPCGLGTFKRMLIGHDNRGDNTSAGEEPGNQLGGFDLRLVSPWKHVPIAVYGQMIGEDEDSGMPSKFLALYGVEAWRPLQSGALVRATVEFASTSCSWSRPVPLYDCAYVQEIFAVEGYRYRGRSLGHSYDNDAEIWSGVLLYTRPQGISWQLTVHSGRLNRGGAPSDPRNTVSPVSARLEAARLEATGHFAGGHWTAGVGYEDVEPRVGNNRDDLRVQISWWRDFGSR